MINRDNFGTTTNDHYDMRIRDEEDDQVRHDIGIHTLMKDTCDTDELVRENTKEDRIQGKGERQVTTASLRTSVKGSKTWEERDQSDQRNDAQEKESEMLVGRWRQGVERDKGSGKCGYMHNKDRNEAEEHKMGRIIVSDMNQMQTHYFCAVKALAALSNLPARWWHESGSTTRVVEQQLQGLDDRIQGRHSIPLRC